MTPYSTAPVTIPAWLLAGLVDCHDAATPDVPCEFVAEARRYLKDVTCQ